MVLVSDYGMTVALVGPHIMEQKPFSHVSVLMQLFLSFQRGHLCPRNVSNNIRSVSWLEELNRLVLEVFRKFLVPDARTTHPQRCGG